MSRYIIRFEKHGWIRYTSHLDLLRLFKRSFKRVQIYLEHSHGFHPHPKMSFAQPLSLGYESSGDYLEFDTQTDLPEEMVAERLQSVLPEGIRVTDCRSIPKTKKPLAALIYAGRYRVTLLDKLPKGKELSQLIAQLLEADQLMVEKRQKKTKRYEPTNIRPLVLELEGELDDNKNITLNTLVRCGSEANLNPELLAQAFCRLAEIPYARERIRVERTDLYCPDASETLCSVKDMNFMDVNNQK